MVHRDLKLENILLANKDPNDFNIKVYIEACIKRPGLGQQVVFE